MASTRPVIFESLAVDLADVFAMQAGLPFAQLAGFWAAGGPGG